MKSLLNTFLLHKPQINQKKHKHKNDLTSTYFESSLYGPPEFITVCPFFITRCIVRWILLPTIPRLSFIRLQKTPLHGPHMDNDQNCPFRNNKLWQWGYEHSKGLSVPSIDSVWISQHMSESPWTDHKVTTRLVNMAILCPENVRYKMICWSRNKCGFYGVSLK